MTISLDSSQRGLRDGERTFTLLVNGKQKADGVSTDIKITKDKFVMLDSAGGIEIGNNASKGKRVSIEAGRAERDRRHYQEWTGRRRSGDLT